MELYQPRNLEQIARTLYGAIVIASKEWGDTLPAWDSLSRQEQSSYYRGITRAVNRKYLYASDSHSAWRLRMMARGWRHGTVKDHIKQTHPGLVEFHRLPYKYRIIDSLWISIVNSYLDQSED